MIVKVKCVFFDFNINFGGAPKGSLSLCSRLLELGLKVVVYDAYGANEKYLIYIDNQNIPYRVMSANAAAHVIGGRDILMRLISGLRQLPGFLKMALRMRSSLVADQVDLIWVNNKKSLVMAVIATAGLDVKKVLYHRGWAQQNDVDAFYAFVIKHYCDALIGHSQATVTNLQERFPEKHVQYVPNSVSITVNPGVALATDAVSTTNMFTIMLPAARPVREKGHDVAVKALGLLHAKGYTDIRMVFPGEVPVGVDNGFVQNLRADIHTLGIEGAVTFIGWVEEMDVLISESDLVILPSHTEGFPRVIIESMLVGTPVIATPVGGIPEAILNGHTGLLVEVDDVDSLVAAIERLYCDRIYSRQLASNAYTFAINHFSAKAQAEGVKNLFCDVVRGAA